MTCKLQIALDFGELEKALEVAAETAPFVDTFEAGTPLLKSVGLQVVRILKKTYPDKLVVADMKSTDVGAFEADLAFEAGADYTVASGVTTLATIREVQKRADQWRKRCIVDLTGIQDVVRRCEELVSLGVNLVLVHRSIDEETTEEAVWSQSDCERINKIRALGMDVMIAGGLDQTNLPLFRNLPLYAVVIGRGITAADNPAAAAEALAAQVRRQWPD